MEDKPESEKEKESNISDQVVESSSEKESQINQGETSNDNASENVIENENASQDKNHQAKFCIIRINYSHTLT